MTTEEHLDKIVAECRGNIALAEEAYEDDYDYWMGDAVAGWHSTLIAIESALALGLHDTLEAIIVAWRKNCYE